MIIFKLVVACVTVCIIPIPLRFQHKICGNGLINVCKIMDKLFCIFLIFMSLQMVFLLSHHITDLKSNGDNSALGALFCVTGQSMPCVQHVTSSTRNLRLLWENIVSHMLKLYSVTVLKASCCLDRDS